jgi:hypothetical protein
VSFGKSGEFKIGGGKKGTTLFADDTPPRVGNIVAAKRRKLE